MGRPAAADARYDDFFHKLLEAIPNPVFELPTQIPEDLAQVYHEADLALMQAQRHQSYEAPVLCTDGVRRDLQIDKRAGKAGSHGLGKPHRDPEAGERRGGGDPGLFPPSDYFMANTDSIKNPELDIAFTHEMYPDCAESLEVEAPG